MSRILINQYRQELERIIRYGGSRNEGAVRRAMGSLLNGYCKPRNFVLVEELTKQHSEINVLRDLIELLNLTGVV